VFAAFAVFATPYSGTVLYNSAAHQRAELPPVRRVEPLRRHRRHRKHRKLNLSRQPSVAARIPRYPLHHRLLETWKIGEKISLDGSEVGASSKSGNVFAALVGDPKVLSRVRWGIIAMPGQTTVQSSRKERLRQRSHSILRLYLPCARQRRST
jgi:hypothetical protein